jgi:hypothetical protein
MGKAQSLALGSKYSASYEGINMIVQFFPRSGVIAHTATIPIKELVNVFSV